MSEKVIVEFRSPEGAVATHVRSTLITASLETLRALSLYDRFVERLSKQYHAELLFTFAPTWLPLELAVAYYDNYERLELSDEELERAASTVSERIMASTLATLLRSARASGATPWIALRQYDRLWARIFQGGSVRILERGPKDALIESKGLSLLRGRYFRLAYRSLLTAAGSIFAKKMYVRDVPTASSDASTLWASWV